MMEELLFGSLLVLLDNMYTRLIFVGAMIATVCYIVFKKFSSRPDSKEKINGRSDHVSLGRFLDTMELMDSKIDIVTKDCDRIEKQLEKNDNKLTELSVGLGEIKGYIKSKSGDGHNTPLL